MSLEHEIDMCNIPHLDGVLVEKKKGFNKIMIGQGAATEAGKGIRK